MDREIAVRWAEVLLSNPDVQGKGSLAPDDDHRCCLGVLEEMLGFSPQIGEGFLHSDSARRAGLRFHDASIDQPGGRVMLAVLNDDGVPFEEIALLIEKHSDEL